MPALLSDSRPHRSNRPSRRNISSSQDPCHLFRYLEEGRVCRHRAGSRTADAALLYILCTGIHRGPWRYFGDLAFMILMDFRTRFGVHPAIRRPVECVSQERQFARSAAREAKVSHVPTRFLYHSPPASLCMSLAFSSLYSKNILLCSASSSTSCNAICFRLVETMIFFSSTART